MGLVWHWIKHHSLATSKLMYWCLFKMDSRNMAFTETVSPTASKDSVYCVCVLGSDGVMSQKRSANFAGSRRSGIKPSFAFYLTQCLPLPLFSSAVPHRVKPLSWSSTLTFVTNVTPITTIVYHFLSRCHIHLGWNIPCVMSQIPGGSD